MIRRKICLLGSFAVGKTSLAARFMDRPFPGRYLTTIGVRVDRKVLEVDGRALTLLIWDLAGEDRFQRVEPEYLRGAAGYFLVADGTRRATLDQALLLHARAQGVIGTVPCGLLLNKADLESEWDLDPATLAGPNTAGWLVFRTSALTGAGVDDALRSLARAVLGT